jgi:hypothetical protein
LENVPATPPGEAFEAMFWGLLRRRYKLTELVKMPSDIGGDCGIEGFSTDGIAYQCYADRDSLSLRARTDKQKAKLNTDTLKLQNRKDDLQKVFKPNSIVIDHYFLLVPQYHAVELVQHAAKRSEVVRGWNLPFIGKDFMIHIKIPDDYPAEMQAAIAEGVAKATLPTPIVDGSAISMFADVKPELIQKLEEKLMALGLEELLRQQLRDLLVRDYLGKEQLVEALKEWPETWEALQARRQHRQEQLELDNLLSQDLPNQRITALIDQSRDDLAENVPSLHQPDADRIARGQVGDWLMNCPLRFPVVVA